MKSSTSTFALAAVLGIMMPTLANAQSADAPSPETVSGWFLSLQGNYSMFEADTDSVRLFVRDNTVGGRDYISEFDDIFSGEIRVGNKSGMWDFSFGVGAGNFNAPNVNIPDNLDASAGLNSGPIISSPYGALQSATSAALSRTQDSARFITADFETGYQIRSHADDEVMARIFGGVRAEQFTWQRDAFIGFSENSSSNEFRNWDGIEESNFIGIGPFAGISFEKYIVPENHLKIFGSISGGVMIGRLEHSLAGTRNVDTAFRRSNTDTVFVPFADLEGGIGFNIAPNIVLSVGYQAGIRSDVIKSYQQCTGYNGTVLGGSTNCGATKRSTAIVHGGFLRMVATF